MKHSENRFGKGLIFQRTFVLLGHILKGEEKETERKPGKDIEDGFRFSIDDSEAEKIIAKHFKIKDFKTQFVNNIPISVVFQDVYDSLWVGRRETVSTKGQIKHECQPILGAMKNTFKNLPANAKNLMLYKVEFNSGKKLSIPLYTPPNHTEIVFCDGTNCKPIMLFRFFIRIGGLENKGVFGLSTNSLYDIGRIPKQLMMYDRFLRQHGFVGGIRNVPLCLQKTEDTITQTTNKTGSFRSEKWMLNIVIDPKFLESFPIFSMPPVSSVYENRFFSSSLAEKLETILSEHKLEEKIRNYVRGILDTGMYQYKNSLYPVSDLWIREQLLPKLKDHLS